MISYTLMQASLYDICIRFVVNKGDQRIRCFNWKTSLKKNPAFSALASKLNTGLINKG